MSNASGGFEHFCGGKFWDLNLTWYTSHPDFTQCFQNTVLVWAPCGFLWLVLPIYAWYLKGLKDHSIAVNKLNTAKTILGVLLAFVALLDMFKSATEFANGSGPPLVYVVSPAVLAATLILATVLMQVERKQGLITSGILFIFWFLLTVTGIIPFQSKIIRAQNKGHVEDVFRFTTFFIYYALVLIQLVLSSIADVKPQPIYTGRGLLSSKKPCPETSASFLSRITFWWITGLVFQSYKKTLQEKDVWELNPRDMTRNTAPKFEKAWRKEVADCNWQEVKKSQPLIKRHRSITGQRRRSEYDDEKTPLLSGSAGSDIDDIEYKGKEKQKEPGLFIVCVRVYGLKLLQAHICKLVCDILTFVGPQLQSLLISYTETANEQVWKGYLYAAMFFVTTVFNSVFFHQLFHIGMTLGMRIKAAVIAAVYKKALTMSNEARKDATVGEIVNLMSVDAQRLQDVTGYLWMIWSSPFQIAIAVYMLWNIIGPSVLTGLAIMILLIPVNGVMATIQRKLQIAQMTQKDQRIKLVNEVLNGMKVLKLYAWELSFREKISAIRNMELETLKKYAYFSAVGTFTWTCAPFLVTLGTFATYVLAGNTLDAQKAFVSLSLFNILRFPINLLPMMISYIVTASVSIKRIGKFLRQSDLDLDNVHHDVRAAHPIGIEKGTFAWGTGKDDSAVLRDVNLNIADGELVAVVGQVGSGKSSLISAVLGEMEKLDGRVNVRGSVAYVAQQAWIQNATLRDNILFGKEFESAKYDKILDSCALKPDLEILPGGDQTEIGEKGINLSGGQKQRVSLARAVYSDSDIYLLDDPLSAVDSHVGKHIFEKVVGHRGILRKKTRILVTHGVHWLPHVDRIVVISHGVISEIGSYDELLTHNGTFAQFLKTYLQQEESDEEDSDPEILEQKRKMLERVDSIDQGLGGNPTSPASPTSEMSSDDGSGLTKRRRSSLKRRKSSMKPEMVRAMSKDIEENVKAKKEEKLIQEEKQEVGQVKWSVFFAYCAALGLWNAFMTLIFFLLFQAASVASNVWLSQWTDDRLLNPIGNDTVYPTNSSEYLARRDLYLGVYGGLGGAQALFVLFYALITAYSMVRASRILHDKMLFNILRSPMSFFDTTPIGRILNRCSRDIETLDNILPQLIRSWMNTFFSVLSTIVVISYSTPIFLVVVIPLALLYYFIQRFYIPTSRQLKRIESTTRSPIYVHFSETITGASTIRAYGFNQRFIEQSADKVDHNMVFYFASIASNRWIGFRLEFIGGLIVFAAAMFAVVGKGTALTGGLVGLSISYALQVTQSLNWMVRMTSDLETNIVSVERVKEYSETPTEDEWYNDDTRPPRSWPDEGKVAFETYSTRYREGLDLVLRGITMSVNGGEKVGIVGRTGAGKSSLTLALFRIVEAAGGSIIIDGIHVANLGLHQLRSKLTILPQDPVLFSGSLRMNLDPFDKYTDEEIWKALDHAHLKDFVTSLPAKLTYECGEGGQNLSVGQRQLVCLARTLLRKTKILILDEATAAVDLETDELIQNTIRTEFADCTVLTIAHRLNTIMDNDRVLVLDQGKIAEYDSPANLLKNKKSIFFGMAKDAGLVS